MSRVRSKFGEGHTDDAPIPKEKERNTIVILNFFSSILKCGKANE